MDLVIVESPTKAKTLGNFLGSGFDVMATMGHIKDLPKSKLGVDVKNNFKPTYLEIKKKEDIVKKIKDASKKASSIFIATDPDREGEAIAAHVEETIDSKKKISRVTFHEITKGAVEEAMKTPHKVNKNLVSAQVARRVLDRLVGYELSPLLWKKVRRGLSAGRVQTVAVRLIVEKEQEIKAFKPQEYWEIAVEVKKGSKDRFFVSLAKINGKKAEISSSKEAANAVGFLKRAKYSVGDVTKREVTRSPYAPFTTSTMTQAASRIYFWSSKKTMSIAQRLYEEGLITYHRTDSTNIAASALGVAREYIEKNYGPNYLPNAPRIFKKKSKLAQEAHEAIRPTNVNAPFKLSNHKFESEAKVLYELISKRFIASQMAESVYDETRVIVEAKSREDIYLLTASGIVKKFNGWRVIFNKKESEDIVFPNITKGDALDLVNVASEQKFTQPPARFTEASLIKTLENLGIGRPSTYAPIISTIQIRNYVEKKEGKFFPTKVGEAVNSFLVPNFPGVFEYGFTAEMEGKFDGIAEGDLKREKVLKDFWSPFEKKLSSVEKKAKRVKIETEKLGKKCPECKKGELVIRIGRFGKFVSCSLFPDCKYTEKYVEKINMKCPECKKGEVIVKKSAKGRRFFGCSRYPDCKWASWKKPQMDQEKEKPGK